MERLAFIKNVLQILDKNNITYCLLRNYDFLLEGRLPFAHSEQSLDVVVSRKDFPAFTQLMALQGFTLRNPQFSHAHHAFFQIDGDEIISFDVQVGGIYWNDLLYLDEQELLAHRVKKSFLYIPCDNDTYLMLLVHSLLGKRYFKQEYKDILGRLGPAIDKDYVLHHLIRIFTKSLARQLLLFAQQQQFDAIIRRKYRYIMTFILKSPAHALTFTALTFRWVCWKKYFSAYPLISVIGPDGAGKTTLTRALAQYLEQHGKKTVLVYLGRGKRNLLPINAVGKMYKRHEKIKDVERDKILVMDKILVRKHSIGRRKILYTLAAPIFTLDLLLRYCAHIFPKRHSRHVVVTDRYCSDIMLMKHVPVFFKKMLLALFPKPTMTFYLSNSSQILHARRPAESIEELERQLQLFEQLKGPFKPIELRTDDREKNHRFVQEEALKMMMKGWY